MIALIAGSTGLVGGHLTKLLAESTQYSEIIALVRTPDNIQHPKVRELVVDFDRLEELNNSLPKIDIAFCCLGTTMKQAGSKAEFYKVDFEYVLKMGKLAQQLGTQTFILNSAMGANTNSIFYYNRVKGEIETALRKLEFSNLIIVRPSLLLGKRKKERVAEKIGARLFAWFGFLFIGPFRKLKAVKAKSVAQCMFNASFKSESLIIESDYIE